MAGNEGRQTEPGEYGCILAGSQCIATWSSPYPITNEIRQNGAGSSGEQPLTIHTWLEWFGKQKPRSFSFATTLVDAENWIAHIEKLFEVLGCADAFKDRLAKLQDWKGDASQLWKAFILPRSEHKSNEKGIPTIRHRDGEPVDEFMKRFLRVVRFLGKKADSSDSQTRGMIRRDDGRVNDRNCNNEQKPHTTEDQLLGSSGQKRYSALSLFSGHSETCGSPVEPRL
ncbi:hypothetical protein Tco_0924358 [Tanacetum coccineum]|uniref:Retrotransposon gag domain-containing protein n=1 Tax=Tanacetum coccineum TaxID=301880 RepID=A0ABQ5DAN2_9ASTR